MNYVAMRQSAELASQAKSHPGGGFETGNRPEHGTTRAPNMRISWKNVRALFNVGFFFFYQATNVFGTWKKSADTFLIGTTHQPADARISLLQTDLIQCCKVVSMFRQEISM